MSDSVSAYDLFGQDIALDSDWQPVVLADGTLQLCSGTATAQPGHRPAAQHRARTLFYDVAFGSLVMMFCATSPRP
jgi:hypothetical protein